MTGNAGGQRVQCLRFLQQSVPAQHRQRRGQFADLKNIGGGTAGTIIGGAFLKQFVSEKTPWAHIDIAGTAWEEKDRSFGSAGATLFGAKLLVEWISRMDQ